MASSQIGGALPADMPPSASSIGKGDKQIAKNTAAKLANAIKATRDPELKATFATALSQFHTYLAKDASAAKKSQAPKAKAARSSKSKKK